MVFYLGCQVGDLNVNNDPLSSELCKLLDASCVYMYLCTECFLEMKDIKSEALE